jgi:ubiquinone/menaquinone biosynthesis C-methylase UbiE
MINTRDEIEILRQCSYPDFVAYIGQDNTPPGGDKTVATWLEKSRVTPHSRVLDLACNTGFSGRWLHGHAAAKVTGIDLSERAIQEARRLVPDDKRCTYVVGNAADLPFNDAAFTHVLAGSNFGFITERATALAEARRVVQATGYLCTSSYYYTAKPPDGVLDSVAAAIGWRPDTRRTFLFWHQFFSQRFSLEYQEHMQLQPTGRRAVLAAAEYFIHLDSATMRKRPSAVRNAACRRLQIIRLALDDHRKYQGLVLGIWRPR